MMTTIMKTLVTLFVSMRVESVVSTCNHTFLSSYRYGYSNNIENRNTVNNLLSTFSPMITNTGFYNSTSFSQSPNSNLYGLYLCRGDINRELCRACVKDAQKYILVNSYYGREAAVWFDHCMLRYSNKPIFGKLDMNGGGYTWTNYNVTGNNTRFKQILRKTMHYLAVQAANGHKGKRFATKVVKFTEEETLYVLMQCTPDLTANDCRKCLVNSIGRIRERMGASKSGNVKYHSCTVRYEIFPFFYSDKIKSFPSAKMAEIRLREVGATSG